MVEQRHGDNGACIGGWWVQRGLLSFVRRQAFGYCVWRLHTSPDCWNLEMSSFWIDIICIVSWLALCICAQGKLCRAGCGGD